MASFGTWGVGENSISYDYIVYGPALNREAHSALRSSELSKAPK